MEESGNTGKRSYSTITGGHSSCRCLLHRLKNEMQLPPALKSTAVENNIFIPDVSIGAFLTRERFAARLQNSVFCENIHSPEDCGYSRAYGNWAVSFKYLFCRTIITNSLKLLFFCKRGINNFFCALYRNKLNTGFYVRRYLF